MFLRDATKALQRYLKDISDVMETPSGKRGGRQSAWWNRSGEKEQEEKLKNYQQRLILDLDNAKRVFDAKSNSETFQWENHRFNPNAKRYYNYLKKDVKGYDLKDWQGLLYLLDRLETNFSEKHYQRFCELYKNLKDAAEEMIQGSASY